MVMAVRILGIDPGTVVAGFAVLELERRETGAAVGSGVPLASRASNLVRAGTTAGAPRLIEAGALRLGRSGQVPDRLAKLLDAIEELIGRLKPDELAVEEAFYGKSVQSALRVGEARGAVLAAARRAGLEVHQFPPARIKRSVTGHGGARKEAVAEMTARSLGIAGFEGPADVGDAAAVALCRAEQIRSSGFRAPN